MEYTFTLITNYRTDQSEFTDALFEAGCDDATIEFDASRGLTELAFAREAGNLDEAIGTAIRSVESTGAQVQRVGPDEYVWAAEIAGRLGLTREYVRLLISGVRGPGGFPAPVVAAARNPLWRWTEVKNWIAAWKGDVEIDQQRDAIIEVFNGALQQRNGLARLDSDVAAETARYLAAIATAVDVARRVGGHAGAVEA